MEYLRDGDLMSYLEVRPYIYHPDFILQVIREILAALSYMKNKNVGKTIFGISNLAITENYLSVPI